MFRLLLGKNDISDHEELLKSLLVSYAATLVANLKLNPGAQSLLSTLRLLDMKIVIISEGPQDSQERIIGALGIKDAIVFLAT